MTTINEFKPLAGPKQEKLGEYCTTGDLARAKVVTDRHEEMWRDLRRDLKVRGGNWPSWRALAAATRRLGYTEYANSWDKSS